VISVVCGQCGESFDIDDDFVGGSEFCPFCGALNDIPIPTDAVADTGDPGIEAPDASIQPSAALMASPDSARGISVTLWWSIFVGGIGLFLLVCVYLFSDNWEARNIQLLSDASNRADALMVDEDYASAQKEYQFVLERVGGRKIESQYILRLMDRARRGEVEAGERLHAPAAVTAVAPQTQPSAAPVAAATQPEEEFHLAIRTFQRNCDAFPAFVRRHPLVFEDERGNWRRRQFFVWETAYDEPASSDSPKILLRYDCGSAITRPHKDRQGAEKDDNFVIDESPREMLCQTQFAWISGACVIEHHEAEAERNDPTSVNIRPSMDDLYPLESAAFHAARIGR
jgi:hypothetical protein